MSYLLDALNKSEAERARKKLPGITRTDTEEKKPRSGAGQWIAIIIAIMAVNAAGFYFLFGDRIADQQPEPAPAQVEAKTPAAVTGAKQSADTRSNSAPVTVPITAPPTKPADLTTQQAIINTGPVPATVAFELLPVVPVDQLPLDIQRELPALDITTHIFASDADLRMVRINDKEKREGESINDDTKLIEVTDTGVVIAYKQYQYSINVVEDWQLE